MSGDDQQGMLGFPNGGINPHGEMINHDQMQLESSSVTLPNWQGDYTPQPITNPEQYGWFSPTEDQGSSQQRLPLEQSGWLAPPAEGQGSNQRLMENSSINIHASSSKPRVINGCYDPMFEAMGLPLDPHLRLFLAKLNIPGSIGAK